MGSEGETIPQIYSPNAFKSKDTFAITEHLRKLTVDVVV